MKNGVGETGNMRKIGSNLKQYAYYSVVKISFYGFFTSFIEQFCDFWGIEHTHIHTIRDN